MENQPTNTVTPILLDCFAMAALTGLASSGEYRSIEQAAESAYNLAQAMLDEKKKREGRA